MKVTKIRNFFFFQKKEKHYLPIFSSEKVESEQKSWDPKRSELCFSRTKPEEILVEVRNGTDVQIVH